MFPAEPAPDTIGAYTVLRRLSGSGSTSVFLGRMDGPLGFQRVCVLKLVPSTVEGDARFAEELAREASICAQLNHPAIVRMFDFFEHDGKLVLVLEHVEGVNLDRLLQHLANRRQKLEDPAVYYLVHQVAGALAYAHAAADEQGRHTPVIHRNLHPENIVIGWDGTVRLTGFGLGKILGRTPDTVVGVVKGSPGYMAPEQSRGERVTTKADVYGVGLLLWCLLTGRRPPEDGTQPPPIATVRKDLPRSIVTLLQAALVPIPDKRAITCDEIEQTLEGTVRAEAGKAELIRRIQSVHANIEIEETGGDQGRRPTIPVQARSAEPSRPEVAQKLAAKRPVPVAARRARPGAPGAPPPPPAKDKAPSPAPASGPTPDVVIPALPRPPRISDDAPISLDSDLLDLVEAPPSAPVIVPAAGAQVSPIHIVPPPSPPTVPPMQPTVRFGPRPAASFASSPEPAAAPVPAFGPPPGAPPAADATGTPIPVGVTPPGPFDALATATPIPFGAAPTDRTGTPSFGPPPASAFAQPAPPSLLQRLGLGAVAAPVVRAYRLYAARAPRLFAWVPRSLSTVGTIAVSAVTATVVVAVWIYFAYSDSPTPEPTSSTAEPPATAAPKPPPTPPPALPPAPPATAAPQPPAPGAQPESGLPAGFGWLTVTFPTTASVYLTGKYMGAANEALQVRCGRWFLRLAQPGESRYPEWVSAGATVTIPCQGKTEVELKPLPGRSPAPRRR